MEKLKKIAFVFVSAVLAAVLGISIWFYFTDPETMVRKHPEYQILKNHLDSYRDSIQLLDLYIYRASGSSFDSLVAKQSDLKLEYQQLRADIIHFTTSAMGIEWFYKTRKKLTGNPGVLAVIVFCSLVLPLMFLMAYFSRKKQSGLQNPQINSLTAFDRSMEQLRNIAPPLKKASQPEPAKSPQPRANATTKLNPSLSRFHSRKKSSPQAKSPNLLMVEEDETNLPSQTEYQNESPLETKSKKLPTRELGFPDTPSGRWRAFVMEEQVREDILRLGRKGMTPAEISRRLRISQDQVEILLRMDRNPGS